MFLHLDSENRNLNLKNGKATPKVGPFEVTRLSYPFRSRPLAMLVHLPPVVMLALQWLGVGVEMV